MVTLQPVNSCNNQAVTSKLHNPRLRCNCPIHTPNPRNPPTHKPYEPSKHHQNNPKSPHLGVQGVQHERHAHEVVGGHCRQVLPQVPH